MPPIPPTHRLHRTVIPMLALFLTALAPLDAHAHPDKIERGLLFHFATGVHPLTNGAWPDLSHQHLAKAQGTPALAHLGPAQGVRLNGSTDWFLIAPDPAANPPHIRLAATTNLSITAWVFLNETRRDGGIIGFAQDNGDFEKGWKLGYDQNAFTFTLSSKGTDDGNGNLTRIRSTARLERGRWHYVAATYDATTMRLFVDGKPAGESRAQSGPILYPETGRFALGAYADDDELNPMDGALFEVKVYNRTIAPEEIVEIADRNAAFLAWRDPVNTILQFVVQPYLQFNTRTGVSIMAETTEPADMTVEYATRQPNTFRASNNVPARIQEVRIEGIKPGTPYFYRVTSTDAAGNTARSEIATFQAAPGPSEAWAFGIIGDTQRNPDVTRKCAEGIFALRPNFLIHCGDVVDDGFAKQQWVFDLFAPSSRLLAHVPLFPVIGNHEKNAHWYYDYFSLPAPEYSYTFHQGNAQFFMIDSNKDCTPGSPQYQWLERELRRSRATWKFACHHHPCFSSDEDDYGDRWRGTPGRDYVWGETSVKDLIPLYERYGLDIAFAGHIHSYERTWPLLQMTINQAKGVRYLVSGGGGGGLEQAGPQRAWFTLHAQRGHHYCFATVQDRTIQFKAYDLEGRLFDTFELTKPRNR